MAFGNGGVGSTACFHDYGILRTSRSSICFYGSRGRSNDARWGALRAASRRDRWAPLVATQPRSRRESINRWTPRCQCHRHQGCSSAENCDASRAGQRGDGAVDRPLRTGRRRRASSWRYRRYPPGRRHSSGPASSTAARARSRTFMQLRQPTAPGNAHLAAVVDRVAGQDIGRDVHIRLRVRGTQLRTRVV